MDGVCHVDSAMQDSQLFLTMMMVVGAVKENERFPWSESKLGPPRYEDDVYLIAPFRHGRGSLYLLTGAWTCKIRQKISCAPSFNGDDGRTRSFLRVEIKSPRAKVRAAAIKSPDCVRVKVKAQ